MEKRYQLECENALLKEEINRLNSIVSQLKAKSECNSQTSRYLSSPERVIVESVDFETSQLITPIQKEDESFSDHSLNTFSPVGISILDTKDFPSTEKKIKPEEKDVSIDLDDYDVQKELTYEPAKELPPSPYKTTRRNDAELLETKEDRKYFREMKEYLQNIRAQNMRIREIGSKTSFDKPPMEPASKISRSRSRNLQPKSQPSSPTRIDTVRSKQSTSRIARNSSSQLRVRNPQ